MMNVLKYMEGMKFFAQIYGIFLQILGILLHINEIDNF